jgi:predicted cupin superfamily sugar epimerase
MLKDAQYWITKLDLAPHPEGGYFRQTYRSDLILREETLRPEFTGSRSASTAIYFLLDGENFFAFHRIRSDELWHFYAGTSLEIHVIDQDGAYSQILLGNNPDAGESFQAVVKAGCWFASQVQNPNSFALVGCTVAPGFDFEDFELAKRPELVKLFPQHRNVIEKLTRQQTLVAISQNGNFS